MSLAFQFWAAYLAHRLRVRRHYSWWLARYAATLIGYAGQPMPAAARHNRSYIAEFVP